MNDILQRLGIEAVNAGVCTGIAGWIHDENGAELPSINPATNETIATVIQGTAQSYDRAVASAQAGFESWRQLPAPKRGELIRDLGNALARIQRAAWRIGEPGKRQDPHRRLGRSTRDDRYLRFCCGLVAAALWLDDALGAARPPHVRAMASTGSYRHYHRFQFSRWRSGPGMQPSRRSVAIP